MNKHIKIYFFSIFLLSLFSVSAQINNITISGQLLDKETKDPIIFASIYLKNQGIGTTTNKEGNFIFHFFSTSSNKDRIIISMIGYESIEKPIEYFIKRQQIYLIPAITDLNEVVITSTKKKKLSAKQIVKKAYKKISKNYPTAPYLLEGFVRDLQNEDGTYVEYLECAAKFYYKGHQVPIEPKVELVEIRSNLIAKKHPWNEDWGRKNSIIDLIEDDFIRFDYGPITGKRRWTYEIKDIVSFNSKYVYKIVGTDTPFQKAVLYIDTETFAFVKLELTRTAYKGKSWKRRLSNGEQQMYYNTIFEYQEYNGKMYLKYQMEEDLWQIFDIEDPDRLLFTKNPKKELFINRIITKDLHLYNFNSNMLKSTSLENQAKTYNPVFWKTYNAPQKTNEISQIERQLRSISN